MGFILMMNSNLEQLFGGVNNYFKIQMKSESWTGIVSPKNIVVMIC
jgi:hypothetical protein